MGEGQAMVAAARALRAGDASRGEVKPMPSIVPTDAKSGTKRRARSGEEPASKKASSKPASNGPASNGPAAKKTTKKATGGSSSPRAKKTTRKKSG